MEERQRVKIVDYIGSKKVETSKIDEKLKEAQLGDPPRHLHRSRPGPEGRRHRPRHAAGEGLPVRRRHARDQGDAGRPEAGAPHASRWTKGPKVKIRKIEFVGNKAISDGTLKRQHEGQQGARRFQDFIHFPTWFLTLIGDGTYQETKFDEDAEKVVEYYRDQGYLRAHVGEPELKVIERLGRQEDPLDRAAHPDHRRAALPGRRLRRRRQHGRQDRGPEAALQADAGRVLQREADPQGAREGAGGVRRRRLLRVHRLPGLQVPRRPRTRTCPRRPTALKAPDAQPTNGPPIVDVTMQHAGGQAVLRQPHHLHRQHDDARQRHPARDAAGRRTASSTPRR